MARKKSRAIAQVPVYTVEILGRRFSTPDMVHASQVVSFVRDKSGLGASEFGPCLIRENEKVVGHVSYNGKVWTGAPETWPKGTVLVYDPFV